MTKDKPLLIDTGRGYTIKYKNKYLYSSVEPKKSVLSRVEKTEIKNNTLIYVPGIGLGYGLKELIQKIDKKSHILCIEADMTLMAFALEKKIEPFPDSQNISIIRADNPLKVFMHIQKLGLYRFRRIQTINLSAGYSLNREVYKAIESVLDNEIKSYWQNKMTLIHMGKLWIKNIFYNLPVISCTKKLNTLNTELPVIIAGAGPSLEESIDWIKAVRENIVLLAVDTALPFLDACSVKPDIIFMLESQHINLQDFIPNTFESIPVLCDISSAPSITKLFKNNIYFFSSDFYPLKLFNRMEVHSIYPESLPALGSVGVAAVYTAKNITSGPVILCGLDFSYTFNRTHAKNTAFHMLMLKSLNRIKTGDHIIYSAIQKRPLLKTKGKNNKNVLSDLILHFYSERIKEVIGDSGNIYDIGPQGLETGAEQIKDLKTLKSVVYGFNSEGFGLSLEKTHNKSEQVFKKETLLKFIDSEYQLLENSVKKLETLLENEIEENNSHNLDFLNDLDYLFFFFPDKEEFPVNNKSFLARTLQSAYEFKLIFKKIKKIVKNS